MFISEDVKYVGVNDTTIDLFEGQYKVPDGISYNSYVILDEKTAVMDTVDINFSAIWLEKVKTELGDRKPDYLVVQHMEPDHSVSEILSRYNGSRQRKDIHDDKGIFPRPYYNKHAYRKRGRYSDAWQSRSDFRIRSYGTLAGGYGNV